jgi:hypothetical protein
VKYCSLVLTTVTAVALFAAVPSSPVGASSHMDTPLITHDDSANTTDVYAFRTNREGRKHLALVLAVYPFEEPGIRPNNHRLDDRVVYDLDVATGADLATGDCPSQAVPDKG